MVVPIPVFVLAGIVNLLAKNINYNIQNATTNPNIDLIRVKRDYKLIETPIALLETNNDKKYPKTTPEAETPSLLTILKQQKRYGNQKTKRDTHQQVSTNANTNNGNRFNDNAYSYNGNQNLPNSGINDTTKTELKSHFKQKPNIFARAYNSIVSSLGLSKTTTERPHLSKQNNQTYSSFNENGISNRYNETIYKPTVYTNQNTAKLYNKFTTTNTFIGNNQPNNNYDRNSYNNMPSYNTNYYNNGKVLAPYSGNVYNSVPAPYFNYNSNSNQINTTPYYSYGNNRYPANNDVPNPVNNYNNMPFNYNQNNIISTTPIYNSLNGNYGSITTRKSTRNGSNDRNGNNEVTTKKVIDMGCILCSTFSCPKNQRRVGFTCQDVNYDDDYVPIDV